MTEIYILVTSKSGRITDVYDKAKEVKDITDSNIVTGPYDIILKFKSNDWDNLTKEKIDDIRNIKGVKETTTLVAVTE